MHLGRSLILLASLAATSTAQSQPSPAFTQVEPILSAHCTGCHGPQKRRGKLRLDSREAALLGGANGAALVPGQPERSLLLQRVRGDGGKKRMPLDKEPLSDAQIATLDAWIRAGAVWPATKEPKGAEVQHWAYVPPNKAAYPEVRDLAWCVNPIDRFVLARLEQEGLRPAPEADRPTLLRRLSLDLLGLPPTPEEVDAFVRDARQDAYERQVDRLLGSKRYGERMARTWLDLARYADTNGYEKDLPRSLWPWRDWLIQALNDDMPFDRFTVEQLAGDLLPDAKVAQKVATGFHRNTMLNDEGGVDPEEFRVVAVMDRVATTANVWLGSTIGCAQCHDHKYDPFSQREYYGLFAFFDSTADLGSGNGPELLMPTDADKAASAQLEQEIAKLEMVLDPKRRDPVQIEWETRVAAELAATPAIPFSPDTLPELERDGAFAYGALVRRDSDGCILSKIDDPNAYRGVDLFVNGGRIEVHIVHAWPENGIKVETTSTLATAEWHHVLMTYDGSSKAAGVRIYVDGEAQPLEIKNDTLKGTIRSTVPWRLGARHASGTLKGDVLEPRVLAYAVTSDDARLLARAALRPLLLVPQDARTAPQQQCIRRAFAFQAPALKAQLETAKVKRQELAKIEVTRSMVMQELPKPRMTHVLKRGDFRQPADAVTPSVPAVLHRFAADLPKNRLGLARWLVSPDNPLVARVAMNRAWQQFFGQGLVRTPEDFGSQGDLPTHPELLDWLAQEFVKAEWSVKSMHRQLVCSRTYRQSSKTSAELLERDPKNELLARGARFRLDVEAIRDQALSVAGLLDDRIGGPSVMPPQPDGVWADSFANYDTPQYLWKNAHGKDRFRRGIYTYLRRSATYPAALVFDGPRRDVCTVQRARTNTPLQALLVLNDPVYHEAALGLARRMLREANTTETRIARGLRLCVAREPSAHELGELLALHERARMHFSGDPKAATQLVHQDEVDVKGLDAQDLASLTVIANLLLNLDETLTRG